MKSNLISKFLHSKNKLSILALFLLLCVDVATALWKNHLTPWWVIVIPAIPLIAEIIYIVRQKNQPTNIPAFFTKLVSSAVMPSLTGVAYLLAFLMHISWISDGVLGLITEANCDMWVPALVGGGGLIVLTLFCPVGIRYKQPDSTIIFVSGISKLATRDDYKEINLRTLVRELQNIPDGNTAKCRMLILQTDAEHDIKSVAEHPDIPADIDFDHTTTEEQLKQIIRTVALKEFPEKRWIEDMEIEFTPPCNYNDFNECFDAISQRVERLDTVKNQLVFNLSPGTGIVGSLMTLLAIDANRRLLYYSQDNSLDDSERLIEIKKTGIQMRNLLSQALETLEGSEEER